MVHLYTGVAAPTDRGAVTAAQMTAIADVLNIVEGGRTTKGEGRAAFGASRSNAELGINLTSICYSFLVLGNESQPTHYAAYLM